jgi:hypothetical protein
MKLQHSFKFLGIEEGQNFPSEFSEMLFLTSNTVKIFRSLLLETCVGIEIDVSSKHFITEV